MCDCQSKTEERLLAHFKGQAPEARNHKASLAGYGLAFIDNSLEVTPFMPVKLEAEHRVKQTGLWKTKKTTQNLMFNFCPFCGVKLKCVSRST